MILEQNFKVYSSIDTTGQAIARGQYMKKIIKSRLDEHMVDLYNRVDNLKKDISIIKNNHLKHMSCSIYKIEKKVDRILWSLLAGMGALVLALMALFTRLIK
jgi:hypothetical protein